MHDVLDDDKSLVFMLMAMRKVDYVSAQVSGVYKRTLMAEYELSSEEVEGNRSLMVMNDVIESLIRERITEEDEGVEEVKENVLDGLTDVVNESVERCKKEWDF